MDSLIFADASTGALLTGLAALIGALGVFITGILRFFFSPKDEEGNKKDERPQWAKDLDDHIEWLNDTREEIQSQLDACRAQHEALHKRIADLRATSERRDDEWKAKLDEAKAQENLLRAREGILEERSARYRVLYEDAQKLLDDRHAHG